MHRVGLNLLATVTILATGQGVQNNADIPVICNPTLSTCMTMATTASHSTKRLPGKSGSKAKVVNHPQKQAHPCPPTMAVPQPPKSDPVWNGHSTGQIFVQPCWLLAQMGAHPFWAQPKPNASAILATVSPAQLARRALAELRIPAPVIHRSPDQSATDAGVPVTWVNVWTWVWTTPASWRPLSKTASLGGIWSTVTVTPTALVFDPGTRDAPVTCAGPGRPWTAIDANAAPTGGGCGYVYRSVSSGVKASLAIRWAVTWRGSGGSAGQLPDMTTRTNDTFAVEQIQAVNR